MNRCSCCNSKVIDIHNKNLSKEELLYYINNNLYTNVYYLDLSNQINLNSDIIKALANSENCGAITFLDISGTEVGYAGINELLRLPSFGHLVSDIPTYHKSLPGSIVTLKIEISNTRVLRQYNNNNFKYPLPIIKDFEIIYGHNCMGNVYTQYGYKEIILLCNGKELARQT